jgi:hypothetical protein
MAQNLFNGRPGDRESGVAQMKRLPKRELYDCITELDGVGMGTHDAATVLVLNHRYVGEIRKWLNLNAGFGSKSRATRDYLLGTLTPALLHKVEALAR